MKVATVLSLGTLALAVPTAEPDAEGANVPISRDRHHLTREDGTVDVDSFLRTLKSTTLKYKPDAQLGSLLQNIGSGLLKRGNVQLTDVTEMGEDELYYGPGQVSGQTFKFDFDTGSSDTFIPGPKCGKAQGCDGKTKYDQSGQDRKTTTSVTYGSGMVTGEDYFDTVTVGGVTATKQNIISLTQAAGFNGTGSDSLMGLGFQSIASSKQTPFFFNTIKQGKCPAKEFSFFLGRQQSGTAAQSQMTMCGRNTAKFTGPITKVPVTKQGYWQTAIQGATVKGGLSLPSIPTTAGQSAIDTGTTLIIAPTVAAESIFAQIPGSVAIPMPPMTLYAIPCDTKSQVSLQFANKQFAINPLDLNFGSLTSNGAATLAQGDASLLDSLLGVLGGLFGGGSGGGGNSGSAGGLCLAGIAGGDLSPTENLYIVGDTFLKNWYSIYHYDSPSSAYVGFAKAKGNQ